MRSGRSEHPAKLESLLVHDRYPHVFSPIFLGPVELKNRFYVSPHANAHTDHIGRPTEGYRAYYRARIEGGCGLAMLSLPVPERARNFGLLPSPDRIETVEPFREVAETIHQAGGKVFGELWYWWGAPNGWEPLAPSAPALGPSNAQFGHLERTAVTKAMTRREIEVMKQCFVRGARHLRAAGFDGLMLHCSHGGLHEQFFSPYFNRRDDDYGGTLENRMRFAVETLQLLREVAGDDMALGIRLNCDELVSGGYGTADAAEFTGILAEKKLIDYVDLDVAIEPNQLELGMPSVFVEPHVYAPYVAKVRGAAGGLPVMSVLGRMSSIADAEARIASGLCDMVGAARALMAEPELVNNARDGKEDRSRTCIACNWCMAGLPEGVLTCVINPTAWREHLWGRHVTPPAPKTAKVVVIGGGPGGLEAARVAALRGHDVVLFEAQDHLGGALELWARLPGRESYRSAIDWWRRELERLGVDLRLGTRADAAMVLAERPEAAIVATGGRYSREGRSFQNDRPIPGHDRPNVHVPEDILSGRVQLIGGRVVMLDAEGMHTGVGIAEMLATAGARVEFVTPNFSPVSQRLDHAVETPFIMQRLRKAGVTITPAHLIERIGDGEVLLSDLYSETARRIEGVDAVVLATGRLADNRLELALDGAVTKLFVIGDAAAPRMLATAAFEGHRFARFIGEAGSQDSIMDGYLGLGAA